MSVRELYSVFLESTGVTTDSRVVASGNIFFALCGENYDGHRFIQQALENGCSLAVIDNSEFALSGKTILVDDVLASLQDLAGHHRRQFEIPVLAITGSNGKTTTKELMRDVLSTRFNTLATRGNLNNHIGVPLTLLELNTSHQIAVIEMGANHRGEIALLCEIAMPTHGLITNIGLAHLEGFGSYDGVLKAKSELFKYLKKRGGTAFINYDRFNLRELSGELGLEGIAYGRGEGLFVRGIEINASENLELEVRTEKPEQSMILKTRLTGAYNLENILAAVCTGIYFGVPSLLVKSAVENYLPENNRSQICKTANNRLFLDAYNANPDSMKAAIINFFSMPGKNKSVILGDMLELGEYARQEHKKIIEMLKDKRCREVILVGKLFYNMPAPGYYLRFENVEKLTQWLTYNPLRDRFILLKGSRGIQLEKCLPAL